MRKKFLSLLLILLFAQCSLNAQIFSTVIDETALQFRVKLIDEFFDRFNYEVDYKNEKPQHPIDKEKRKINFLTLLNLDKFMSSANKLDPLARSFVDYVIDNDEKIAYEDSTWNAEAIGSFIYEKKKYDIVLILKTEHVKNCIYRWVISDIKSSFFKQFPSKPDGSLTIPPSEHGISFISLPEMFNLNKTALACAYEKGYSRNNLVVFDFLMAIGKINMNAITKVVFHFHLKNFDFDVERIEKEKGYNQGWLINKIIDNYEK